MAENRNEIELAKLAQQKALNERLRQFAAKIMKDHEQAETKLEKFIGDDGRRLRERVGARGADRDLDSRDRSSSPRNASGPDQNETQRPGEQPSRRENRSVSWAAIHQQLADQCLATAKRELGALEGAEFDKAYMSMLIVAHQRMIDMDKVFMNYVSTDSREAMEECMKTATDHLREAKEIMEAIKDQPSTQTANQE
jgi:predicted outer membrane protein